MMTEDRRPVARLAAGAGFAPMVHAMEPCPRTSAADGILEPPPASNDNELCRLPAARPAFPPDAVARIERPAKPAMTSAVQPEGWRLVFERRSAPFIDPLMGWTGGREPLAGLELWFPTLEEAVAYARRQGLRHMVRHDRRSRQASERRARRRRAFSDNTLRRLGLLQLQGTYADAMAQADATPPPPNEPATRPSAMDIVCDAALSADDKRSLLMNRAYDEYLLDQREGPGASTRSSRLQEIEEALLALEGVVPMSATAGPAPSGSPRGQGSP